MPDKYSIELKIQGSYLVSVPEKTCSEFRLVQQPYKKLESLKYRTEIAFSAGIYDSGGYGKKSETEMNF